jgi:hypothetical protein
MCLVTRWWLTNSELRRRLPAYADAVLWHNSDAKHPSLRIPWNPKERIHWILRVRAPTMNEYIP